MVGKREAVRQDLTKRLLDAAQNRITQDGLSNVRARAVVEEAGCALGTIYKCFEDFDDLILKVNSRTLAALSEALADALNSMPSDSNPLTTMALAYAKFARAHPNLWAALFEHRMPQNVPVPDWHIEEHAILFEQLITLIDGQFTDLDPEATSVRARTFFSAIHGIVSISLQDRFVGVPEDKLETELKVITDFLNSGES